MVAKRLSAQGFDRDQDFITMASIVNLRTERKRAKRRQAERQAAASRLVHGRSKAERALEQSRAAKAEDTLDGHRIETGDGP